VRAGRLCPSRSHSARFCSSVRIRRTIEFSKRLSQARANGGSEAAIRPFERSNRRPPADLSSDENPVGSRRER
jgi:hypothetical protein